MQFFLCSATMHFNPLPPYGGRPGIAVYCLFMDGISIHSLRMEGDYCFSWAVERGRSFQSTPSVWRETSCIVFPEEYSWNFNPLPPYGGRRHYISCRRRCCYFNPLPPYGGRPSEILAEWLEETISIHSLRMEGDLNGSEVIRSNDISIHSLRMEGDPDAGKRRNHGSYFNPLPPYGGRQQEIRFNTVSFAFQSTPSVWRETFP